MRRRRGRARAPRSAFPLAGVLPAGCAARSGPRSCASGVGGAEWPGVRASGDYRTTSLFGTKVPDPYRWLEDAKSPEVQAWQERKTTSRERSFRCAPRARRDAARLKELAYVEQPPRLRSSGGAAPSTAAARGRRRRRSPTGGRGRRGPRRSSSIPTRGRRTARPSIREYSILMGREAGRLPVVREQLRRGHAARRRCRDGEGLDGRRDPRREIRDRVVDAQERRLLLRAPPAPRPVDPDRPAPGLLRGALPRHRLRSGEGRARPREDGRPDDVHRRRGVEGRPLASSTIVAPWAPVDRHLLPRPCRSRRKINAWRRLSPDATPASTSKSTRESSTSGRADGAPSQSRIFAVDPAHPDRSAWTEIVPERADATLEEATIVGGKLVLHYLKDVQSLLEIHDLSGKARPRNHASRPSAPRSSSTAWSPAGSRSRRLLLPLRDVQLPPRDSRDVYREGGGYGVVRAEGADRQGGLRRGAGLRDVQGRNEGPDVPRPREDHPARRDRTGLHHGLRRLQHPAATAGYAKGVFR